MSTPKEKKIKQAETIIIKRSQIQFASYNPKKHTKDLILKQLKNFKDVGDLGGKVWNEITGNLVSGHKRIMAMDVFYKNTKEVPVDYDVKVEKIALTEKQEKEQNIFMDASSTNTGQDVELLSLIIPDIDYKLAGLTEEDIKLMVFEVPDMVLGDNIKIKEDFKEVGASYEQRKIQLQQAKKNLKKGLVYQQGAAYVTFSFDNYENKAQFLDTYGFRPDTIMVKGEEFFDKLNK